MRKIFFPIFIICALLAIGFQSCIKDTCSNKQTYIRWNPVYKTDAEMKQTPQYQAPKAMVHTGKIYFYQKFILVNEQKEGIHIIDNRNPSQPHAIGFLSIPGNVDMAVKGDYLYADSYKDLLTIDISTISNPRVTCRAQDVFPSTFWRDPQRGWLVDYIQDTVTQVLDCDDPRIQTNNFYYAADASGIYTQKGGTFSPTAFTNPAGSTSAAPSGVGGSLARFTFLNDYLYCIDNLTLRTFDLARLDCPALTNSQTVNWNIETVFPYKDKLFIGSTTGMFIYDLVNPAKPVYVSRFNHGRACDPVVVENDTAYITVRSGATCGGTTNQLQIVSVVDLLSPQLVSVYEMTNPRGLGVWDNTLYLCDAGLKIFDVKNKYKVDSNLKSHIKDLDAFDLIPYLFDNKKYLMVIGAEGLYQFDVTDPANPKELSKIIVKK